MSVVTRGLKNAFRNKVRTGAIIFILAISIGLALSMLLANRAVNQRITDLKTKLGTTILVRPAGSQGFQGGGEPLQTSDADKVKAVAHVSSTNMILDAMVQTEGAEAPGTVFRGGPAKTMGKTNLQASIEPGTLGKRFGGDGAGAGDFKLPIRVVGTSGDYNAQGSKIQLTSGRQLQSNDGNAALVGKNLAQKNGLHLDSPFTAYGETFTVVGIFDTVLSLKTILLSCRLPHFST